MVRMEDKPELRKRFRALRDGTSPEDRAAWSDQICRRIVDLCVSRRYKRIGAFWPLGSEVDLRPLIQGHPDWTFVFPKVSSTHPPRLVWGPEPLEPGPWGLLEPVHAQQFMPPVQLLLVPGLVFDDLGYRIGYGKGFYDVLLGRLPTEVLSLGACFSLQRVDRIPYGPPDHPVRAIVSELGLRRIEE